MGVCFRSGELFQDGKFGVPGGTCLERKTVGSANPYEHASILHLYFRRIFKKSSMNLNSDFYREFTFMRRPERVGERPCDTYVDVELSCVVHGRNIQ